MDKIGLEMSFAWMFALIAGAAILFIAVYFAISILHSGEYEITTKTAKAVTNVFDSLLTSGEDYKVSAPLKMSKETRIYVECNTNGNFGESRISIAEESTIGKGWTEKSGDVSTENQNIFAEESIEGKNFYFFIMPFKMPFKISEIMIIHSEPYCFIAPPNEIEEILESLAINKENVEIKDSKKECKEESVTVCFDSDNCDIVVQGTCDAPECEGVYETGIVRKQGQEMFFIGNLMYAAIFSSKENYECNLKRTMIRLSLLSKIYYEKSKIVAGRCSTGLQGDMKLLSDLAKEYSITSDLETINLQAEVIDKKNQGAICQLY